MGKFYVTLLSLLSLNFVIKAQENIPSFIKESHSLQANSPLKIAVPYKSKFYCLKSNGEISVINRNDTLINPTYTDNSKALGFIDLRVRNDTLFGINDANTYYLSQNDIWTSLGQKFKSPPLFEDSRFIVTSTCSGEWGGTVYFKDKKSYKKYEAACPCAVNVFKHNGEYIITSSLTHLLGFTNIFTIKNPLKLQPAYKNRPKPIKNWVNGHLVEFSRRDESNSTTGTKSLVDSAGVIANSSFVYKGNIFYIVSEELKTNLCYISNKKLVTICELAPVPLWNYDAESRTYNEGTVYSFINNRTSGFVVINQNKLTFYYFN